MTCLLGSGHCPSPTNPPARKLSSPTIWILSHAQDEPLPSTNPQACPPCWMSPRKLTRWPTKKVPTSPKPKPSSAACKPCHPSSKQASGANKPKPSKTSNYPSKTTARARCCKWPPARARPTPPSPRSTA